MKTNAVESLRNDYEDHLLDHLIVFLKRKVLIFSTVAVAGVLAAVYAFSLPDTYTATARVLVPQKGGQPLGGMVRDTFLVDALIGGRSYSDGYVSILESRTVADILIERFDLERRYGRSGRVETREALTRLRKITQSPDAPAISVSVEDEDPQRAAAMANAYVDELDRINRERSMTEGHLKRIFLEKRLEAVKNDLLDAEEAVKVFQEKYNLVAVDDQARAAIDGAASIKSEIIRTETDLQVLRQFGTDRKNAAIRLRSRLAELNKQLSMIEKGENAVRTAGTAHSNFYIPFKDLPSLMMAMTRLQREARIQEELFKLVTTQYELAKIEEARDMETIQVLDRAVPPDRPSGPKRALLVGLSSSVGLIIGIFLAVILEFRSRVSANEPERYREFLQSVAFRRRGGNSTIGKG